MSCSSKGALPYMSNNLIIIIAGLVMVLIALAILYYMQPAVEATRQVTTLVG